MFYMFLYYDKYYNCHNTHFIGVTDVYAIALNSNHIIQILCR